MFYFNRRHLVLFQFSIIIIIQFITSKTQQYYIIIGILLWQHVSVSVSVAARSKA
jgi:hypothetical protein